MTSTFALVCLGLITLGLWIAIAACLVCFLQIRRTFQAIEVLTYHITESTEKLRHAGAHIQDFTDNVRSGWMKALELVVAAAQHIWAGRGEARPPSHPADDGEAGGD